MTLDDGGASTGKWEEVTDIIFTPAGTRLEKVVYAPPNTLTAIQLDPGDMQDLREVQPFVLTTSELPKYFIRYLGREQLDEISCYSFRREAEEDGIGQAIFRGDRLGGRSRLADRQELRPRRRHQRTAIINIRSLKRTASRSTASIGFPPTPSRTPRCTSRKTISASKKTVKYEDYKQFKSDTTIKYETGDSKTDEKTPPEKKP